MYFGIHSEPNLLGDPRRFDAFVEKAGKVGLHTNIQKIDRIIGDTRGILTDGRKARNAIAHGSNFLFNTESSDEILMPEFEAWMGHQCEAIVIANFTVLVLMGLSGILDAGLPHWDIVSAYPKNLTEWILLNGA